MSAWGMTVSGPTKIISVQFTPPAMFPTKLLVGKIAIHAGLSEKPTQL